MVEVIWTEQAYNDLREIHDFIEIDSIKLANYVCDKIYETTLLLRTFPTMGRIVPEINSENIRELIEGKYRVVYEIIDEQIILIQAVRHGSRYFDVSIN